MTSAARADHDRRFTGRTPGASEPFFNEMLPLLPRGLALDVGAATGRHSLALARAGLKVVAIDHSAVALETLGRAARAERLCIWPIVAEFEDFPIPANKFDLVVNINFLDRTLTPALKRALRPGGMLLFDTFLIDQATLGHPRNRDFMLAHYELRALLEGLTLLRYQEGLTVYPDGTQAWRAGALARRI
ncbi:MAG TPA: class I SAM-dependent methyltransferase [Candidatus Binataceae bacterium]|nr:class I SAM-dependent methyltransferase [Candidatus Binataceae bacterium]